MRPSSTVRFAVLLVLLLRAGSVSALPVLSVADTSTVEGDAGSHVIVFRVHLSQPTFLRVSFHYETLDGTATVADGDYLPVSGDLQLSQGITQAFIGVPVLGDSLLEGNERFTMRLSAIVNALPIDPLAVGTILNDEHPQFARFRTGIPDFGPGTLAPAWGDANADGRPDLPMYLNLGGAFTEMPGFRALLGDGNYHGGAWCDYDRDGDMDLVLMPYGEGDTLYNHTRLFENTPTGFLDVSHAVHMDIAGPGETPVWADFDADGWPDLFLPFYSHVSPFRSFFYRNLHDGEFEECADSAGVTLPGLPIGLRPEGACAADWNGDGAIDLYCAQHLFINDGDAHFTDVRAQVGLPVVFDEGAQFVDYDDDGDLDLYLRTATGPTLFRNDGGTFVDVSPTLGIGPLDWLWGDRWTDIDLDGDLDLLVFDLAGYPRLMLADGDGTYTEDPSFPLLRLGGTLCAFADIDADGDPDIVVGEYGKQFARSLIEEIPRAHTPYLKVKVVDDAGMLVEQGSTVRLRSLDDPKHPVQTRIVDGGSGYLGQDEYVITFGGVGSGTYDLEVSFPGKPGFPVVVGPAQNPLLGGMHPGDQPPQIVTVRPNHQVTIETLPSPVSGVATPVAGHLALAPACPNPARQSTRLAFALPVPGGATLTIFDLAGRRVRTLADGPRPAGPASVTWDLRGDDGRAVSAGLYLARLSRDGRPAGTQRVVVLR